MGKIVPDQPATRSSLIKDYLVAHFSKLFIQGRKIYVEEPKNVFQSKKGDMSLVLIAYATREGSDESVPLHSLARAFAVKTHKVGI